jgi:hypothetical protein
MNSRVGFVANVGLESDGFLQAKTADLIEDPWALEIRRSAASTLPRHESWKCLPLIGSVFLRLPRIPYNGAGDPIANGL